MNSLKRYSFLAIFLSIGIVSSGYAQNIVINEILAANKKVSYDGFGDSDDWMELYNPLDSTVSLAGMFLSDDPLNPTKHRISTKKSYWTSIAPKKFMLLWMDAEPEQGQRHISFQLNKEKGFVAIYDRDTNLVDSLYYELQETDVSTGRFSEDDAEIAVFPTPTPNKPNIGGLRLIPNNAHVQADVASGFYDNKISVQLSVNYPGVIHYTTDGSEPTIKSNIYKAPILLDSTTILRSRVIREGYKPNFISTNTYFIQEESSLSVVSLVSDPRHLWGKKKGIYRNYEKRGWERPAHIEYFDRGIQGNFELAFSKTVDIRIAGKTSRRQPKKSFAIFANDQDGEDRFNYQIFDDKPIESFGGIWVRSDATSGRNVSELWVGERFKNELLYEVNSEMKGNVAMQAYEPILLFLNGEFWGLYNLMERKGKDFITNNYGCSEVNILTGENTKLVSGSMNEYDEMIAFVATNDITSDSIYNALCQMMDVSSYIDYWVYETYCGARDINVNIRYWKTKEEGGKWRWISYDQDSWYRSDEPSLSYYLDKGKVFLLIRLMKNEGFRNQWLNRMCDYLNTGLEASNVLSLVDQITDKIALAVPRDKARWQDTMLYIPSGQRINWIKEYASERPVFLRDRMISYFNLGGATSVIKFDVSDGKGSVRINSLQPDVLTWEGIYLDNVPIEIEAIPKEGYAFIRWKKRKLGRKSVIVVLPKDFKEFVPVFKEKRPLLVRH